MGRKITSFTLSAIFLLLASACSLTNKNPNTTAIGDPLLVPAVEMTVQADAPTPLNTVGQNIQYTYSIKNIGTVAIPGVINITGAAVICPDVNTIGNLDSLLDVDEILICVSSHTITQDDLTAGSVTSITTASVNGTLSNPVSTTVATQNTISLTLNKTASPSTYDHVGQTITYTYIITNTTPTTLGPVQFIITDTGINTPINCGNTDTTLASNATVTCSAPYTITQADIDSASITTSATASGNGIAPSQPINATLTKGAVVQNPSNLTTGTTIQHQVAPGEWLWQIARCYGADPKAVVNANQPNPEQISPKTNVTVPNIGSAGKIYGPPCVANHTVQTGETWNSIAQKYNASPDVLQMVNANTMAVGTVLKVPLNSAGSVIKTSDNTASTCVDVTRNIKLVNTPSGTTHFNVCGTMNSLGYMKIGTLKISQLPEDVGLGGLLQDVVIPATIETSTPINEARGIIVEDMNYDGNDDFRIIMNLPATTNIPYLYYIFDPATNKFIYNEAYRKITSPEFPGNNEIVSQWTQSAGTWGIDTYLISSNNPVLTKRETWESINETQAKHQVLTFNAEGTSTVTVDEVITIPTQ